MSRWAVDTHEIGGGKGDGGGGQEPGLHGLEWPSDPHSAVAWQGLICEVVARGSALRSRGTVSPQRPGYRGLGFQGHRQAWAGIKCPLPESSYLPQVRSRARPSGAPAQWALWE